MKFGEGKWSRSFFKRLQILSVSHSRKAKSPSDADWVCQLCKHRGLDGACWLLGARLRIIVPKCLSQAHKTLLGDYGSSALQHH